VGRILPRGAPPRGDLTQLPSHLPARRLAGGEGAPGPAALRRTGAQGQQAFVTAQCPQTGARRRDDRDGIRRQEPTGIPPNSREAYLLIMLHAPRTDFIWSEDGVIQDGQIQTCTCEVGASSIWSREA
jgi:hypothetical protein